MRSTGSQRNEWLTTRVAAPQDQYSSVTSNKINVSLVDDNQNHSHDYRKRRFASIYSACHCCSAISPFILGVLLGVLTLGLALAVIISLWLTSPMTAKDGQTLLVGNITATTAMVTNITAASTTTTTVTATTVPIPIPCPATAALTGPSTLKTLGSGAISYTCFSFNWTATAVFHTINFKFRHDSNDWYMDDVSILDSSANQLIINGGFEGGTYGTAVSRPRANNWTWSGSACGCCIGVVSSNSKSGRYSWGDGCNGATDNLSQSFSTTIGNTYFISWWLRNAGSGTASFNAIIT